MATIAHRAELKLPPEGKLALLPVDALLGRLGLLQATGVVDFIHKKLNRRLVMTQGRIQTVISNAREDRFIDWWAVQAGGGVLEDAQRSALFEAAGNSPLTNSIPLRLGYVQATQLHPLLVEWVFAILSDTSSWKDASYRITPGRVPLGDEPFAGLPALHAGLMLARIKIATTRRPPPPPRYVQAYATWNQACAEFDPVERGVIEAATEPSRSVALINSDAAGAESREQALAVLVRVGVLIESKALVVAEIPEEQLGEVTEVELQAWLTAAAEENLEQLLGVAPHADAAQVRKAYYRTVRRYHPDRFRSGPLASFYLQVEGAFRLVHEAIDVLTDPAARSAWLKRHDRPAQTDPAQVARDLHTRARRALKNGQRGEAVELLERAVAIPAHEPTHAVQLWLLLLGNPRRRAEALERLEELSTRYPARADVLAGHALGLLRHGKEEEAKQVAARALQIDATELIARFVTGQRGAFDAASLDPFLSAVLR